MNPSLRMFAATACLAILGQPFVYAGLGRDKDKEANLIARIESEQNPGKKARLQLRLAKLKLKDAGEAYDSQNFQKGKALLQQYLDQIRNSWVTLQHSESGAGKHLGALKELEISLREDDRFLEDLSRRVPYPESENIMAIEKESSAVHNQVLEAIFPSGIPPKERRKRLMPPRSWRWAPSGIAKS